MGELVEVIREPCPTQQRQNLGERLAIFDRTANTLPLEFERTPIERLELDERPKGQISGLFFEGGALFESEPEAKGGRFRRGGRRHGRASRLLGATSLAAKPIDLRTCSQLARTAKRSFEESPRGCASSSVSPSAVPVLATNWSWSLSVLRVRPSSSKSAAHPI
jgi:hypothetical protein